MVGLKELDQFDYGVQYQRGQPSVTQVSGIAGLASPASLNISNATQNSLDDMRRMGEMPAVPPPPSPTPAATKPVLAISRSTGKIWANGKLFTTDDAQGAIESEQFVGGAPVPAPAAEASDWEPLSMDAYSQHLQKIKNPSLGTLASKNFGIGVDNAQMLAGYGLQFLGATETGQGIVQQQLQDINKNAPYQRNFTDIGSDPSRGYLDWFVANLAQQGPNLVESVVTAAVGAGAGALAGGGANPATAAGGLLTSLVGKQAFKQSLLAASKKYMAGEALDAAESKLLREAAGLTAAARKELFNKIGTVSVDTAGNAVRYGADDAVNAANKIVGSGAANVLAGGRQQAIMGGAALATGLQNYATGVADLFGESVEGGDPNRGLAALGGIPYAALETVPEYIAALRIFKGIGARTTALAGKSYLGKAGEIGTRAAIGGAAGAGMEGGAEAGQELLGIGMNDTVDADSPEGMSRILNAFAAGAAIGGFIGAGSNLNTGKPHDILSGGTKPADMGGTTLTGEVIPPAPQTGGTTLGPDGSVPALPPPSAPALGGPAAPPPPPTGGVSPETVVSPGVGQTQQDMFMQQPAQALPSATTIYNPAPTPSPMLTGPEIPQRPAPSVAPDVINLPGPGAGSALQQAAEGTLTGGIPTGPIANRLQQQAAAARARAQQEQAAAAEQARQAQVQATSGSALARIGRGEMTPPIDQPGGRVSMGGEATGQMVEPMTGKARLKRRKKGQPLIEGMPANAAQEGVVGQDRQQQYPQDDQGGSPAKAGSGDSLKRGRKAAQKEEVAQAEQQPGPEVSAAPVHDKFIADFDDAQLNDANKVKLRALVKRAAAAGVLSDKDMKELDIAFKDRDTTADDIAPLASSLIEANKPKAEPKAAKADKLKRGKADEKGKQDVPTEVKTEVVPDKKEPPKLERQRIPKLDLKPKEEPSPKAEGAAAAPEQKADFRAGVKDIVGSNVADAIDQQDNFEEQATSYYSGIDISFDNALQNVIDTVREQFPNNEAALSYAQELFSQRREQYMAANPPKPGTVLALVDDKKTHFVDPEIEAYLNAKRRRELADEADFETSDEEMVQDMIDVVDSADPFSVEYKDALDWLFDAKATETSRPLRTKINKYLTSRFTPDEIALMSQAEKGPVSQASLDRNIIVTTMEQINSGQVEFRNLGQMAIGGLVSAWKRIKSLNLIYGDTPLADYIKGGPQFFNMKDGKVVPKTSGRYSTTMWDTVDNPMSVGAIKLKIDKLISNFARKPNVYVFRNQADLKASDSKLYAKLAAGRDGDFDTVNAAGYSMGDTVVIFADRIASMQHLSFVLAHETLGHFGFRGLMGQRDFDALMGKLYDTDPRLKAGVDAAMKVRGLPKAEAVEEYLADYAAQLHTSLVRRVWNGIKGVLNRVGIQFGDEATRYLLSQARRYVKTGQKAGVFQSSSVAHRLWGVETGQVGRFAVIDPIQKNEFWADMIRHEGAVPMDFKSAREKLGDASQWWDTFKEQVFSLANFQALRNPGLYRFEQLLDETRQREQYIYNKYNAQLEKLLFKSEAHRDKVSRMLLGGRVVSVYRLLDKPLGVDDAKKPLFSLDPEGDLIADQTAVQEYINRGILKFEEMRDGVEYVRTDNGKRTTQKFEGIKDLTQEQYDDYVLARETIAKVELELLEAKYRNALFTESVSKRAIRKLIKSGKLEGDAEKLVGRTSKKYKEIYVSGYKMDERGSLMPGRAEIDQADKFLEAVNRAVISGDNKNDQAVRDFFDNQKQADDFVASLEDFRSKRKVPDGELTYLFQNEMKRIILDDVNLTVEEERAKRTMVGGYVPIIRDKAFEMRLRAVDEKGNPLELMESDQAKLVYSQFDNRSMAKEAADLMAAELKDVTAEMMVRQDDGSFKLQEVRFQAAYGPSLQQVGADPALNLDEFMHGLRLFKINLAPDKMSLVIRTLTEAGDQLRKRMEFSNTPGYDKNSGVFAMTRHIQTRAATIAKTITRPAMRELMDQNNGDQWSLWTGDLGGIFSTYTRWQNATDPTAKQHYRHQLDHKLSMFVETYPGAKGWDGSKAGYDKLKADNKLDEHNYNRFYNSAQKTLAFLEKSKFVGEGNFESNKWVSMLRAGTSILQLGGSIAQGVMNMVSPYTNWLPYMASYNQRNGFGGGFGVGQVMAAYQRALNQVGLPGIAGTKYNTAEFYDGLLRDPDKLAKSGLTEAEAAFLSQEIREGKLIPAQSNALLGTARTGVTNRWMLRGIDTFMLPFNRTEQASRRAAGLAAFRLAMERMANVKFDNDPKEDMYARINAARDFAIQSLDLTLGEYSVLNRPPAWRDGIQSFLYMYKVYPTTTIQLLRRLDKKGQIIMLGTLWMFAGITGFPFAEDIEDLLDTIAQALGLQMGSVRAEFIKVLEDVAPGVSPYVLKGAVNTALGIPADVASRFSQGDFIPGSGILLAGSTIGEEVKDILGPMPAMTLGLATFTRDIIAAPFSEGKTIEGALRAGPITLGRMFGDSYAYMSNGAVVDRRGYVVSPDMTIGTVVTRLLGFYPKAAAEQYEAIRIAKRVNNYQKEVVAGFRTAWVKAMLTGDRQYARQVEQAVDEWNRAAKGTQLEIGSFLKNSQRALKEAKLSAAQRTLRATSKAGRDDATRMVDLMIE
jgi:hypothetical protein